MRYLWLIAVLLIAGIPTNTFSHAIIKSAEPKPSEVISRQPYEIALEFNVRVDHKRSRLILVAEDDSSQILDISDQSEPQYLRATLNNQKPGHYRLRWEVLAQDGHITRGDIPFEIR